MQRFALFLRGCPKTVQEELAREPLLLYLLGAMHRDSTIKREDFQGKGEVGAKIQIYNQSVQWVLTKQRTEYDQEKILGLKSEELKQVLMTAGLCVIQSRGEYSTIKAVSARLEESSKDIATKFREIADNKEEESLKNALAAFYLKSADTEGVEFFCSKAMEQSFLSQPQAKEIYDLLGYGNLTREVLDYLFGLLEQNEGFDPEGLFAILHDFYFRWCDGEYMDVFPEKEKVNYLLWKMGKLRENPILGKETSLGMRQVDIYTGLNVLILLLELQRYGKDNDLNLSFHLCGKVNNKGVSKDRDKLSRIISYSDCLGEGAFSSIVDPFLGGANLNNANLEYAQLENAQLENAQLENAQLENAQLENAKLSDVYLKNTNLENANLEGIRWNEETRWKEVKGLETAMNVPPGFGSKRERSP